MVSNVNPTAVEPEDVGSTASFPYGSVVTSEGLASGGHARVA
jgi:hypothetical protein